MAVTDPLEQLAARQASRNGTGGYAVHFTDDKQPKLILPDVPAHDDLAGLCAWLTCVLQLDSQHPVTGAAHQGQSGPRDTSKSHVPMPRRSGSSPPPS